VTGVVSHGGGGAIGGWSSASASSGDEAEERAAGGDDPRHDRCAEIGERGERTETQRVPVRPLRRRCRGVLAEVHVSPARGDVPEQPVHRNAVAVRDRRDDVPVAEVASSA